VADEAGGPPRHVSVGAVAGAEAFALHDVVETALARALVLAAEEQRWELVAQIATELAERRMGRGCSRTATAPARPDRKHG
jgi:hypothetical protein